MKRLIFGVALCLFAASTPAAEYQCGLYRISLEPVQSITLNGVTGRYAESVVDKYYNFHHIFTWNGKTAVVRETTHGRLAFKIPGQTLWNACKPVERGGE